MKFIGYLLAVVLIAGCDSERGRPVQRALAENPKPEVIKPIGALDCLAFAKVTKKIETLHVGMSLEQVVQVLGQPSETRLSRPKGPQERVPKFNRWALAYTPAQGCKSEKGKTFLERAGAVSLMFNSETLLLQVWSWEREPFQIADYP